MQAEANIAGAVPQAGVEWHGDVPVSAVYGDPYWSLDDGLAEAVWVHVEAPELRQRLAAGATLQACELGFGAGLNLLALWREARRACALLRFWSVELHPLTAIEMARALSRWSDVAEDAAALAAAWRRAGEGRRGDVRATLPGLELRVVIGEAARAVEAPVADHWLLDGFAPARNPAMWRPEVLGAVGAAARPGGTAATYAAASAVRRGLEDAGFETRRLPGFGRKRHMTVGTRR